VPGLRHPENPHPAGLHLSRARRSRARVEVGQLLRAQPFQLALGSIAKSPYSDHTFARVATPGSAQRCSHGGGPDDDGARSRQPRPHRDRCSGCAVIQTSGRSERGLPLPHAMRVGPTTPTCPRRLPLGPCRLDRLSSCRTMFATERLSPSTRERVHGRRPSVVRGWAGPPRADSEKHRRFTRRRKDSKNSQKQACWVGSHNVRFTMIACSGRRRAFHSK
jgi:hypothetical protein